MNHEKLAEAAAELQHRALAKISGFQAGTAARQELRGRYCSALTAAESGGRVESLRVSGHLRALCVLAPGSDPWTGGTQTSVLLDFDRRSSRARDWARSKLRELLCGGPGDLVLTLSFGYRELLTEVDGATAHVSCALLMGSPRRARRGLGAVNVGARLEARGLAVRKLTTEAEIELVLSWKAKWFTEHPEYGRHCSSPVYLAAEREEMREGLAAVDHEMYLFCREGEPLGYFGYVVYESAAWGRSASMDLQLTPVIQGQGLALVAYSVLVDRMLAQELDSMRGGTSQPGVLALGRRMGRPTMAWILRRGPGVFPVAHFLG